MQGLSEEIKQKRHLTKNTVLLHQDNAPVHISTIVMAKNNEPNIELLSTHLIRQILSDYFLFPNLKNGMVVEDLLIMKR